MEGRECRDLAWGENGSQVFWRGGSTGHRERRERESEREKGAHRESNKSTFPQRH